MITPKCYYSFNSYCSFLFILFFTPLICLGQPEYESSLTNTGSASNATISKPSPTVLDDLLVVGLMYEKGSSEVISPPNGWTLIDRTDNSSDAGMITYFKIVGPSEPSSYSFGLQEGSKWSIGISRISNVSPVPIDVFGESTGSGTNVVSPSVTTSEDNTLVLLFYSNKKDASYTEPGGTTERYDDPNSSGGLPSNMLATFVQSSAGSTGQYTAVASEAESWVSQAIAIAPLLSLPVELSEFKVSECNGRSVCLSWITLSELNNDFFEVERSQDGVVWECIQKLEGKNNSNHSNYYFSLDESPYAGINYYRLKQTDNDNSFSYSNVEYVYIEREHEEQLTVYPNPANDNIIIEGKINITNEIQFFNLIGKNVTNQLKLLSIDDQQYQFDISQLQKGAYFIVTQNFKSVFIKL